MSTDRIEIPIDLAKSVARGSCVLFLGADALLGTSKCPGPPTRTQLANALARRYGIATGPSLVDVTEHILAEQPRNRHALIRFLRDELQPSPQPTDVHHTIVDLGFDAVVTAWYDDSLEQAFRSMRKSVACIVSGLDVAYASYGEDAIIIKLYGDINQPDSLVLTRRDMMRIEGHLAQKLEDVRTYIRLRPIIFVGWDPGDERLARLHTAATESLGEHKRRNYIVWHDPNPRDVSWWQEENVQIIKADPPTFLSALKGTVCRERSQEPGYRPGQVMGKLPYKFLDYYDPEDRDIFCGRQVESALVYRMTLAYPLLTLFGQSGVGKTSLLRAGVVPLLLEEGYCFAYIRALGDPLQAIREGVCTVSSLQDCPGEPLQVFLQRTLGDTDRIVIILDQFEELFIRVSKDVREQFWREMSSCLGMTNPEVHFIVCMREDFLPELDEARRPLKEGELAPIPNILRDSYRLTRLVTDTAYLAIVEPARRVGCSIEPRLVDALLGRIAPSDSRDPVGTHWSLAEADGTIPPPSLQIVMDCLYRQALSDASHEPPEPGGADRTWKPPPLTMTMNLYRTMGGAGGILAEYVASSLDEVPLRGGDYGMAMSLLKVMVTSQATKAALGFDDIVTGLAEAGPGFDDSDYDAVALLHATLVALTELRLVRGFKTSGGVLYELAHDHMVAEVATWINEEEMQAKLARELLRRELASWRSLGKLIEPAALRLLDEQRESLRRLDVHELELLLRSALEAGHKAVYWFVRAREGGVDVDEVALGGLHSDSYRTRAVAVAALAQLGSHYVAKIASMLADDYPQVRVAAILALEALQPEGNWREHLKRECYVRAGEFIMGDDGCESDFSDREVPKHTVYVDAFYISARPVTNADYKRYMDDIGQPYELLASMADHPVTAVSWRDAWDYAEWASMRLLTEAEWEKAASWEEDGSMGSQPGQKLFHPWGEEFADRRCNTIETGIGNTTSVDAFSPAGDSPHGCLDMAGNVWEWCNTSYRSYPYRVDDGRELVSRELANRVLRGGSFVDSASTARCSSRTCALAHIRSRHIGFRVGWSASPPIENAEN